MKTPLIMMFAVVGGFILACIFHFATIGSYKPFSVLIVALIVDCIIIYKIATDEETTD